MPRKTNPAFAEVIDDNDEDDVVSYQPLVATNTESDTKSARVKGTWKMFWGQLSFDFEDGKRYKLPKDLYEYLRASGNIYDTL